MIITRLIGGMGNQMFQYAAGRRLALHLGVPLKLDLRDFETYKLHKYVLDQFNIDATRASTAELKQFRPISHALPHRLLRKIIPARTNNHYINEPHFHFAHEILDLPDGSYLDGYWQSEKYFIDVEKEIKKELTVKNNPTGQNQKLIEDITHHNAVALHIRRGDYVTNKSANKLHGTINLDYYDKAVHYLLSHDVVNPQFYVFSDDPQWVKTHLTLDHPTIYVTHNDKDHGYEDVRLMSHCKHFVIANSTFSWWGAWLSHNDKKIVIAPKVWFAGYDHDTSDLVPNHWIRL